MKKYICYGGYVVSAHDGDEHYVSARRVALLHKVDPRECIMVNEGDQLRGLDTSLFIELHPEYRQYVPADPNRMEKHSVTDTEWEVIKTRAEYEMAFSLSNRLGWWDGLHKVSPHMAGLLVDQVMDAREAYKQALANT